MDATRLGESCWVLRFPGGVGPETTRRVLAAHRRLSAAGPQAIPGLRDTVPGLDSLAVHCDPKCDAADVRAAVEAVLGGETDPETGTDFSRRSTHTLPTRFDGPDLDAVAAGADLDAGEVVAAFVAVSYTVAAIGFLPHFPYLLGLDPRLSTPRRDAPRTRVPAGSVAIGNDQAGVYPRESPGGWNLLGHTDPGRLVAIRPGDLVRFAVAGAERPGESSGPLGAIEPKGRT